MSPEELARISVCASAGWGMEGIGEAGRVFQTEGYDLPDFPVSDGNSGVNLNIKILECRQALQSVLRSIKNYRKQSGV